MIDGGGRAWELLKGILGLMVDPETNPNIRVGVEEGEFVDTEETITVTGLNVAQPP